MTDVALTLRRADDRLYRDKVSHTRRTRLAGLDSIASQWAPGWRERSLVLAWPTPWSSLPGLSPSATSVIPCPIRISLSPRSRRSRRRSRRSMRQARPATDSRGTRLSGVAVEVSYREAVVLEPHEAMIGAPYYELFAVPVLRPEEIVALRLRGRPASRPVVGLRHGPREMQTAHGPPSSLGALARRPLALRLHQVRLEHLPSLLVGQRAGGHRHDRRIRRARRGPRSMCPCVSQSRRGWGPVVGQSPDAAMDFRGLAWTAATSRRAPKLPAQGNFLGGNGEADDEARTRDPQLGKLMLYQLSYVRNRLGC